MTISAGNNAGIEVGKKGESEKQSQKQLFSWTKGWRQITKFVKGFYHGI